jgi:beta-lactam-binding protein with PASTA domain
LQPTDLIYAQDPQPEAEVVSGMPVIIFVSKGPSPLTGIPNVVGMNRLDAIATLNNAGFFKIHL